MVQSNVAYFQLLYPPVNELPVENRVLLLKLCASVLRASSIEVPIPSLYMTMDVAYVQKDFSFILNIPSNSETSPVLLLNAIQCIYCELTYYLINYTYNIHNLFVIYDRNNVSTIELFYVPPENIDIIEFAFVYIRDEI